MEIFFKLWQTPPTTTTTKKKKHNTHTTVLQTVISPSIPFGYFPAFSGGNPQPASIHTHTPLWAEINKRPVTSSTPFVLWFASGNSCPFVVAACWQEQVYFLIYFTRWGPKERSLRFPLILLKRPVLFRVGLKKETSRRVKCTWWKNRPQLSFTGRWRPCSSAESKPEVSSLSTNRAGTQVHNTLTNETFSLRGSLLNQVIRGSK